MGMTEKILIVDDDVETLRLVGMMLQRQGYKIVAANNGSLAISMVESETPDLIILDVMMPEMDGYQVAQQLRGNPGTASIPILMFTAKSQVEDKVSGYEAGADDYLTKPIHPAELVAHVKALLLRRQGRSAATAVASQQGYVIGIIAPRGGLGSSSVALNVAISYFMETKSDVIAAELRPGLGSWAMDLGFPNQEGLNNLLKLKPSEINLANVEKEITRTTYGVRLLMASDSLKDSCLLTEAPHFHQIVKQLSMLSPLILLDIGANILPDFEEVLALCDEIILITEPFPGTVQRSRKLLDQIVNRGVGTSKQLSLIVNNRMRADIQLSANQVEELVGQPVSLVIPPAPELAYQAGLRSTPLALVMPDGLLAQQYERFVKTLAKRVKR
jgi:CheY-like chemotaxis protein